MEFFRIKNDIPFMRYRVALNLISVAVFVLAVFFLATRGLHLSIEFTGGTVVEVSSQQAANLEAMRDAIGGLGYTDTQVQNFGSSRDVMIRLPLKDGSHAAATLQSEQVVEALRVIDPTVELRRVEFVGPQIGQELFTDGSLALLFMIVGIMIYLALRFEWKFAL
ncbi:MAG: protein translocase subunit SecF, partial [Burkholderiaceae bacterium]